MDMRWYRAHREQYEAEIEPLREDADAGDGSYEKYDEAYNCWLEVLHALMDSHLEAEEKKAQAVLQ
jgi:hypothetical protein